MPDRPEARPLLSVVSPVYNEVDGIDAFISRATAALDAIDGVDWELVLVNDGSRDGSVENIERWCGRDARIRLVDLSRNFGHQLAISAGLDHASGDAVVVMDSDLQDPPEVVAEMVERWREGYKVVYGVRRERRGESRFKLATARWFYRLINRMAEIELPLDVGDFRLMDRAVVDVLCSMREENRYVRGLVSWIGFEQTHVSYDRDERTAGETKFGVFRMVRFALDGLTSFSDRPLRLATQVGFLVTIASLLWVVFILVTRILTPDSSIQGWSSLMATILFLGGVQLLSVGILGEYLARVYRETKRRPLYVVQRTANLDHPLDLTPAADARSDGRSRSVEARIGTNGH